MNENVNLYQQWIRNYYFQKTGQPCLHNNDTIEACIKAATIWFNSIEPLSKLSIANIDFMDKNILPDLIVKGYLIHHLDKNPAYPIGMITRPATNGRGIIAEMYKKIQNLKLGLPY